MSKSEDPEVKETPAEKAAAEVAMKSWQRYQDTGVELENTYMEKVDDMDSAWQHNMVTGETNKTMTEAYSDAADGLSMSQFNTGADPSSGRYQGSMSDLKEDQAADTSTRMIGADQGQEDRHVGGLQNVVAMGNSQATTATAGLNDVARNEATTERAAAVKDYKSDADDRTMAGMATGAGLSMAMR